ncbi:MAG: tetratricopeptide repeat protein, partial [Proteobacteria bacterium]|nr:tetratricopeptide repeat protein [Pseudomonadota bacterium]
GHAALAGPNEAEAAYKKGDYATAMSEWRDLADLGFASAQYHVGIMYLKGQGVKVDQKKAAEFIQKAAKDGYVPAQHVLGTLYLKGQGVAQDNVQAHTWLSLAVAQGRKASRKIRDKVSKLLSPDLHNAAQLLLAELIASPRTGLGDLTKAAQLVHKVAESGYAEAQFQLSEIYLSGRGVPQDKQKAYMWLILASNRGHETAKGMDNLVQGFLIPAQIAGAINSAQKWKPCGTTRPCPK